LAWSGNPSELLSQLLRFDTTNPPGAERECIEWLEGVLRSGGLETRIVAAEPERPNLVARLPGDGAAAPLLLQGHVDVVSTAGQRWTHPPFDGVVANGCVWGRGALDMKGGVAMMVAAVLALAASETRPAGDLVLALLCDEEAGGDLGARFLVERHPELFEGVGTGSASSVASRRTSPAGASTRSRSPRRRSAGRGRRSAAPAATARSRCAAEQPRGWPVCCARSTAGACRSTRPTSRGG
jgi:acetylornithine deacetylase/succinyl-diaminopimelate desuccinylase-like protein